MAVNKRHVGLLALGSAMALTACGSAGASEEAGKAQDTIKIGVSASFSGATSFYGEEARNGVKLAVRELNAKKGGLKYDFVISDDECTPDGGASAYGDLIDVKKVDVILGSPCSGAALGGMALLPAAQIPALVVSATNPAITEQAGKGRNEFMWRMNIGDDIMSKVFAKYIAGEGVTRLATIAVNNDYGRGGVEAFKKSLPAEGVKVVTQQFYTQGGGEFRSQLNNIGKSGAEAMLIIGAHQDAAVMMRQLKELDLGVRVFARGDVVSSAFQEIAKDPNLGNGIEEANNWDATYDSYPDFAKEYRSTFGHDAQSSAVQAWIGVNVIAQAVEAGGADAAGIEKGLGKIKWKSPLGTIQFDAHNQAHHDMFILGFVDGKVELIKRAPTS